MALREEASVQNISAPWAPCNTAPTLQSYVGTCLVGGGARWAWPGRAMTFSPQPLQALRRLYMINVGKPLRTVPGT